MVQQPAERTSLQNDGPVSNLLDSPLSGQRCDICQHKRRERRPFEPIPRGPYVLLFREQVRRDRGEIPSVEEAPLRKIRRHDIRHHCYTQQGAFHLANAEARILWILQHQISARQRPI